MKIKYPKSRTSIDDMSKIIWFFEIEQIYYTDCTTVHKATFEQLRLLYNLGKDHAQLVPEGGDK